MLYIRPFFPIIITVRFHTYAASPVYLDRVIEQDTLGIEVDLTSNRSR